MAFPKWSVSFGLSECLVVQFENLAQTGVSLLYREVSLLLGLVLKVKPTGNQRAQLGEQRRVDLRNSEASALARAAEDMS